MKNRQFPSAAEVERLRSRYPVGTRLELIHMNDPYAKLPPGTMGTVTDVDDAGQVGMKWDNGSSLSLIPGVDSFRRSSLQMQPSPASPKMGGM